MKYIEKGRINLSWSRINNRYLCVFIASAIITNLTKKVGNETERQRQIWQMKKDESILQKTQNETLNSNQAKDTFLYKNNVQWKSANIVE